MSHPEIAIVGGGLCGLTCAVALKKLGIVAHVFEAATKFDAVGAGVGLGPNAVRVMKDLGLLDLVLAEADPLRPFRFVNGMSNQETIYDHMTNSKDQGLSFYRPTFVNALIPLLDPAFTHFGKRCKSVTMTDSGRHTLQFSDGTTHNADLIIGADGIKSIVREYVTDGSNHLASANTLAYRSMVSIDTLKAAGVQTEIGFQPLCWVGLDKHVITYPIQGGKVLNIAAMVNQPHTSKEPVKGPWAEVASQEDLMETFAGWGDDVLITLKHVCRASKWTLHMVDPPLHSFVRHRVVLIGDAAHAMLPHLGAGVGQGFEDIYVLCRFLGHPQAQRMDLKTLLKGYDMIRPSRANMVLERTKQMGELYDNYGRGGYSAQDLQTKLPGMWAPVWNHDLAKDVADFFASTRKFPEQAEKDVQTEADKVAVKDP